MSLFQWLENSVIDLQLKIETEREGKIYLLPEEQRRIDAAIQTIVDILESSCKTTTADPDIKNDEAQLTR